MGSLLLPRSIVDGHCERPRQRPGRASRKAASAAGPGRTAVMSADVLDGRRERPRQRPGRAGLRERMRRCGQRGRRGLPAGAAVRGALASGRTQLSGGASRRASNNRPRPAPPRGRGPTNNLQGRRPDYFRLQLFLGFFNVRAGRARAQNARRPERKTPTC